MPDSRDHSPNLLDRLRQTCWRRQYSDHTEKAHARWIVRFHDTTHPRDLDASDVRAFLNYLAVDSGR